MKLGLDENIVDVRESTSQDLLSVLNEKIDSVWDLRHQIIDNLRVKIPVEKENALLNSKLVGDLIN